MSDGLLSRAGQAARPLDVPLIRRSWLGRGAAIRGELDSIGDDVDALTWDWPGEAMTGYGYTPLAAPGETLDVLGPGGSDEHKATVRVLSPARELDDGAWRLRVEQTWPVVVPESR